MLDVGLRGCGWVMVCCLVVGWFLVLVFCLVLCFIDWSCWCWGLCFLWRCDVYRGWWFGLVWRVWVLVWLVLLRGGCWERCGGGFDGLVWGWLGFFLLLVYGFWIVGGCVVGFWIGWGNWWLVVGGDGLDWVCGCGWWLWICRGWLMCFDGLVDRRCVGYLCLVYFRLLVLRVVLDCCYLLLCVCYLILF